MITAEQIVGLYIAREKEMQQVNAKRREVRDAYNGELRVTLPDLGRAEPAAVANLLNTGLDRMSQLVSSTMPQVYCPPRDEMVKREVQAADKRRKAIYGWWEANDLNAVIVPRRARQMLAYAQSPVLLWPDFTRRIPTWRMRDAMGTFPSAPSSIGDFTPTDCIFSYQQTYGWVKSKHPDRFEQLKRKEKFQRDDKLTLLDYVDADWLVTVVLADGPKDGAPAYQPTEGFAGSAPWVELERIPNRAGICLAVTPGRVTLDRMIGHFDGVLNLYRSMAHMTALELIAVEKAIFPDTYLESRQGEQAKFITGPHDGRTGLVNIISGGTIREVGTNPGVQTWPTIDRLERSQRVAAGIPAEWGGESTSNIRTGKRGDSVLSAAVDFPVAEQQKVLAASLREENRRAIAVEKGWFGDDSKSFYVSWKNAKGQNDYVPNVIWTTDHNIVTYSHAGSDINGLTIMVGQLVGMGTMSKQTAMELLPIIEDPEREHDRGVKEALEAALLAAIQQKVNAGEIAPVDAAWLMQQVGQDKMELAEAMIALDKRVQERQQAAAQMQADPAMANPMAGLATGTAAEGQVVPPSIPEAPESQQNLASLLGSLRMPQMTVRSERPAV